jgi:hypothetical protein
MRGATERTISISLQTLLFWIVNIIGSFTRPFQIRSDLGLIDQDILWDGILYMLLAYGVALLFGARYKRLPMMVIESTIAFAIAVLLGYWTGYDSPALFSF